MSSIHSIDIAIVIIYFLVVLTLGFWIAKKDRNDLHEAKKEDFFLAGKKLAWPSIGFSLFASNISSATLVGLAGAAYSTGLSISNYEWFAAIILVFFSIYFIPYYVGNNIFTMPEFLEKRFDGRLRYYFSGLSIVGNIFIDMAATLFAGSLVIKFFFPEIEFWQSAAALAIIAGIYTAAGGLAAVVYTDVIQAVILIIGSTIITYLAYLKIGNWSDFVSQTPPELFSVIRPSDDKTMPWTGLLTGVPILGFYFWCTNQYIVQRVLGAKNIYHARIGSLFGGFLKLPVLFIMVYPGLMARAIFPDLGKPDMVFPVLVSELLPIGLKGLVLSGLMAAIMSSIDSTLHSASTLVTLDFVHKLRPGFTNKELTKVGRIVTIIIMVLSILWVPVVAQFETLFGYLQMALAYLFPPVVAVFIVGLFWKGASSSGAFWGMVIGHVLSLSTLLLNLLKVSWLPQIHFLVWAGIYTSFSAIVIILLSLKDKNHDPQLIAGWVYSRKQIKEILAKEQSIWNQNIPWYGNFTFLCVLVLFLTFLLVIFHW